MPKLDYNTFAEQIKAKYPVYKDAPNDLLARKMVEKYPVYADKVEFQTTPQIADGIVQMAGMSGEPFVPTGLTYEQAGKGAKTTLPVAAAIGAQALAPGVGPFALRAGASAVLQGAASLGASALSGDADVEQAADMAMFDAALSGATKGISTASKAASPYVKRGVAGLMNAVSMGKTPYNTVRLWFKNGPAIEAELAKAGKAAPELAAKRLDEMYPVVDAVDTAAQSKFKDLQKSADRYRKLVGKAVGAADKRLEKAVMDKVSGTYPTLTVDAATIGGKAKQMMAEASKTEELATAYADQIGEVSKWLNEWGTKNKTVTELIGAKRALDIRLKDFHAAKSKGLSQGSADLVDGAFSSIRGEIDGELASIAKRVGMKEYAKTYQRASDFYKYYDADLGSLINSADIADKTISGKVNNLSTYIEGRPGGFAAFEATLDKSPVILKRKLEGMMNTLAARRAVQAAGGSPSGVLMTLIRAAALRPQNAYRVTRMTDKMLSMMKAEERGAISQALPATAAATGAFENEK